MSVFKHNSFRGAIDKKKQCWNKCIMQTNMFLSQWIEKYQEKNAGCKTYMSLLKSVEDKLRADKMNAKRFK